LLFESLLRLFFFFFDDDNDDDDDDDVDDDDTDDDDIDDVGDDVGDDDEYESDFLYVDMDGTKEADGEVDSNNPLSFFICIRGKLIIVSS